MLAAAVIRDMEAAAAADAGPSDTTEDSSSSSRDAGYSVSEPRQWEGDFWGEVKAEAKVMMEEQLAAELEAARSQGLQDAQQELEVGLLSRHPAMFPSVSPIPSCISQEAGSHLCSHVTLDLALPTPSRGSLLATCQAEQRAALDGWRKKHAISLPHPCMPL